MKKQNKFTDLSISELSIKQKTLLKQLVTFKVSLDPSTITESKGIDGLIKDIRSLRRQIALVSSQKKVVGG